MIIDSGATNATVLNHRTLSVTMTGSAVKFTTSPLTISSCAVSVSTGVVTIATSAAHQLVTGQFVNIVGTDNPIYQGQFAVTVVDTTHFTYQLPPQITLNTNFAATVTPDGLSGTPQVVYRIMAQRMWVIAPAGHTITFGPTSAGTTFAGATSSVTYIENPPDSKFYLDNWYAVGTNADVVKIDYV